MLTQYLIGRGSLKVVGLVRGEFKSPRKIGQRLLWLSALAKGDSAQMVCHGYVRIMAEGRSAVNNRSGVILFRQTCLGSLHVRFWVVRTQLDSLSKILDRGVQLA